MAHSGPVCQPALASPVGRMASLSTAVHLSSV